MDRYMDLIAEIESEGAKLPVEAIPNAIGALQSIDARLRFRLYASGAPRAPEVAQADRLLDVKETAAVLNQSTSWVYRNQHDLPRVALAGRSLRFSARGLQKLLKTRQA